MAATGILKHTAAAKQIPRDWLISQLNKQQSQHRLAAQLGESPASISRALAEYRIVAIKRNVFSGYRHSVKREWAHAED